MMAGPSFAVPAKLGLEGIVSKIRLPFRPLTGLAQNEKRKRPAVKQEAEEEWTSS
jgi:hypothetical protein